MTVLTKEIKSKLILESFLSMGKTKENPIVAAVIFAKLNSESLLLSGATETSGGRHAEIVCLDKFDELCKREPKWKNAKLHLFTTLEPCTHFGKTPPCTTRLIKTKNLKCLTTFSYDPNLEKKAFPILLENNIKVKFIKLNQKNDFIKIFMGGFINRIKNNKPRFHIKMAVSSDGCIGVKQNRLQISGEFATAFTHVLRSKVDAVVVGMGTIIADSPNLNFRIEKLDALKNYSLSIKKFTNSYSNYDLKEDELYTFTYNSSKNMSSGVGNISKDGDVGGAGDISDDGGSCGGGYKNVGVGSYISGGVGDISDDGCSGGGGYKNVGLGGDIGGGVGDISDDDGSGGGGYKNVDRSGELSGGVVGDISANSGGVVDYKNINNLADLILKYSNEIYNYFSNNQNLNYINNNVEFTDFQPKRIFILGRFDNSKNTNVNKNEFSSIEFENEQIKLKIFFDNQVELENKYNDKSIYLIEKSQIDLWKKKYKQIQKVLEIPNINNKNFALELRNVLSHLQLNEILIEGGCNLITSLEKNLDNNDIIYLIKSKSDFKNLVEKHEKKYNIKFANYEKVLLPNFLKNKFILY